MALRNFKIFIVFTIAFSITTALGASLESVIEDLEKDDIRRCEAGCDKTAIRSTFNFFLSKCNIAGCNTDFVLRVNPLDSICYIQQYCVLSEPIDFAVPKLAARIQVDLIPEGARMVLVAVPKATRTESETFQRPYVVSKIIPRNQLFIINQFVKKYCGVTV